jgi:hypothetical protein
MNFHATQLNTMQNFSFQESCHARKHQFATDYSHSENKTQFLYHHGICHI